MPRRTSACSRRHALRAAADTQRYAALAATWVPRRPLSADFRCPRLKVSCLAEAIAHADTSHLSSQRQRLRSALVSLSHSQTEDTT